MKNSTLVHSANQAHQNVDTYLKFQLNRQTSGLIHVKHTQEAVIVPVASITPMPSMTDCILGLMNWRSRICWAIDLTKILDLDPLQSNEREYNVVIVRVESALMGLVVQSIKGTTKISPDIVRSPIGQLASSLVPYLRGCVWQEEELSLVLDAEAIVQSSLLRN
jgi:positive phototaxis protein PixI